MRYTTTKLKGILAMRIKGIFKPSDHSSIAADKPDEAITAFFAGMFPGVADPEIDRGHTGLAVLAHNPELAKRFGEMSRFMMLDMDFSKRADLRELALQAINLQHRCSLGSESRVAAALAAGLSAEILAALPYWRTTTVLNEEQRLVVEYAADVVAGEVTDDCVARVIAHFGEKGAVEFTAIIAFWSAWAIILTAANV
jgi:4-carboxymuconolactone decarboxylase